MDEERESFLVTNFFSYLYFYTFLIYQNNPFKLFYYEFFILFWRVILAIQNLVKLLTTWNVKDVRLTLDYNEKVVIEVFSSSLTLICLFENFEMDDQAHSIEVPDQLPWICKHNWSHLANHRGEWVHGLHLWF